MLYQLITKDIAEENETKNTIVSLRVLYIVTLIAFILDTLFAGVEIVTVRPILFIVIFLSGILLLIQTYFTKTNPAFIQFIIFMFVWTITMIPVYGWSAGMQNYYIIILMLCFFTIHGKLKIKFILSGVVLAFRIATIEIYGGVKSIINIPSSHDKLIQITNISAVFISIIYVSYVFSQKVNAKDDKLIRYNNKLKREANTDELTGLYNRRRAMDYIHEFFRTKYTKSVSVAMGDIDFFKNVNDTYGHDVGDEVLKSVAQTLKEVSRDNTFISRWGGEEFLIVFPDCNGDHAYIALERIRNAIEKKAIEVEEGIINITMTFGLAELSFQEDEEYTINQADEKLYIGKTNGRNQVVY